MVIAENCRNTFQLGGATIVLSRLQVCCAEKGTKAGTGSRARRTEVEKQNATVCHKRKVFRSKESCNLQSTHIRHTKLTPPFLWYNWRRRDSVTVKALRPNYTGSNLDSTINQACDHGQYLTCPCISSLKTKRERWNHSNCLKNMWELNELSLESRQIICTT